MNVSLTPDLEKFIVAKVRWGRYNSASEVVREALWLLQEQDSARAAQLAELRAELGRRQTTRPSRPPRKSGQRGEARA